MKASGWIILAALVWWAAAAGATTGVTTQTRLGNAPVPPKPGACVQLAGNPWAPAKTSADKRRQQHPDQDVDSDEYLPPSSDRKVGMGRKPGINVTAAPNGYDAKHLNRLWGRFNGAKTNTKAEKTHKATGGDEGSRPSRWAR